MCNTWLCSAFLSNYFDSIVETNLMLRTAMISHCTGEPPLQQIAALQMLHFARSPSRRKCSQIIDFFAMIISLTTVMNTNGTIYAYVEYKVLRIKQSLSDA